MHLDKRQAPPPHLQFYRTTLSEGLLWPGGCSRQRSHRRMNLQMTGTKEKEMGTGP